MYFLEYDVSSEEFFNSFQNQQWLLKLGHLVSALQMQFYLFSEQFFISYRDTIEKEIRTLFLGRSVQQTLFRDERTSGVSSYKLNFDVLLHLHIRN